MRTQSSFARLRAFVLVSTAFASFGASACGSDTSAGRQPHTHRLEPGVSGAGATNAGTSGAATDGSGGTLAGGSQSGASGAGSSAAASANDGGVASLAGSAGNAGAAGTAGSTAGAMPGGAAGAAGVATGGAGSEGVGGVGGVVIGPDGCPLLPALKLTRVVALAQTPMLLTQAAGDPRLFIAERPGRILIVRDGTLVPAPFLDIRSHVAPEETERGLLSMALHPEFATNGRFFVVYTRAVDDAFTPASRSIGDLVLAEGKQSSADADVAEPTLKVLLTVPKANRYHNGGMIAFGKDGYLLMAVGEDGKSYSTSERPSLQQRNNLIGKLLRIDVDAPSARVPGNYADGDARIWSVGVRNPWRLSFDKQNGDLYIGDLGEGSWEEIDYLPAGQGQKNLGWPDVEGDHCSPTAERCDPTKSVAPIHEFAHTGPGSTNGNCGYDDMAPRECNRAVVGGYVYRGRALPELDGRYFFGDFINNFVESLIVKEGVATCHAEHTDALVTPDTPIQGLVSFSEDADGELYVLDLLGNVYRLDRG